MKSSNAGSSFQIISGAVNVAPSFISSMAQSQVNPHNMIFGAGMDHPNFDTVFIVKISSNEGVNWTDVTTNIPGESRWISRVVTDPLDANTMYVLRTGFSVGNKVWKTTDLGQTWTNLSGNLSTGMVSVPPWRSSLSYCSINWVTIWPWLWPRRFISTWVSALLK